MNFLLYYKTEIILNATPQQLVECLQNHIEPWDPFARIRKHKQFWGSILETSFNMTYISDYRDVTSPTVYGKFIPLGKQTKISLESRPQISIYPASIFLFLPLFLCSWSLFWGSETKWSLTFLIPFGTIFVIFIFVRQGFEDGTEYTINELIRIVKESSVNE